MLLRWSWITVLLAGTRRRIPRFPFGFPISVPPPIPVPLFVVVVASAVVRVWWRGKRWLVHWLVSSRIGLPVAFAPFSSLLFLSPVFLGCLAVVDYFIDLTDDVFSVRQEISIFVDRRVPRKHFRPIDVGNVWERDNTFAVRPIDLVHWPVPLELCLAALSAFSNIRGLVGVRMHVGSGITHKRRCSWLVCISKGGRFRNVPGKICDE